MNDGNFVKVFDVQEAGFRAWEFPAFGLIFVAIGLLFFFSPKIIKAIGIPFLEFRSWRSRIFRHVFPIFAVFWTVVAFSGTYSQYRHAITLVRNNGCLTVEGPVENFVPMPYSGHAMETFSVDGVKFAYSDFNITGGFNTTSSHGGPINAGSYVRLCYDAGNHDILRLEIRDFKGNPQAASKPLSLFPTEEDRQKLGGPMPVKTLPFYGNAFIAVYILDFVGIFVLYGPYLRTFFRLKVLAIAAVPVLRQFDSRGKLKLKNSLLYRDPAGHEIWLRPRGLNIAQVPLTVARLTLDDAGTSIDGAEIRFSSGFPLVMILFFLTAYLMFTTTAPADFSTVAGPFIAVIAIMFTISGYFGIRRLKLRMERLLEDAVEELKSLPRLTGTPTSASGQSRTFPP